MSAEKIKSTFITYCGIVGAGYLKVAAKTIGKDAESLTKADVPKLIDVVKVKLVNILEPAKLDSLCSYLKSI